MFGVKFHVNYLTYRNFAEQSERLRVTHDKYREEVYRLLDEYKTTLEELEAYHLELKGNVDRRSTGVQFSMLSSHRKCYYLLYILLQHSYL